MLRARCHLRPEIVAKICQQTNLRHIRSTEDQAPGFVVSRITYPDTFQTKEND